nr:putative reverse transcriptase domain-containing protein [Tanacetum cinerariifolium]
MNSGAGGSRGDSGSGGSGGTGGNADGTVGLCQWFERLESVFQISECKENDRVKFAMATLRGRALTWWNERTKSMGIEAANNTPWSEVKEWMTEDFCPRSVIQRMEQELYNLRMKGMDIERNARIRGMQEIAGSAKSVGNWATELNGVGLQK